jgi:putative membrane protein
MSSLDDPRVLFAAERTLMAWSRTAAGLIALGFIIDRSTLLAPSPHAELAMGIGVAFVVLGIALSALAIVQYRRSVAALRPVEIPPGYWVNLTVWASALVAGLGAALAVYLLLS